MSGGTRPGIVVRLKAVSVSGQNVTFELADRDDPAYFEAKLNDGLVGFFLDAPRGDGSGGAEKPSGG